MRKELTLTREQLEMRRVLAAQMFQQGKGVREVARLLEVAPSSASRWKTAFDHGGFEALKAKKPPGAEPRLRGWQKKRLLRVLAKGPMKAGFPGDLWTCARVAQLIERKYGVHYHPDYVGTLLHRWGWSCQMPEQQAREGDDAEMRRWREQEWPRIKKGHTQASFDSIPRRNRLHVAACPSSYMGSSRQDADPKGLGPTRSVIGHRRSHSIASSASTEFVLSHPAPQRGYGRLGNLRSAITS